MTTPDKEEMPTDRTAGPLATSLSRMIIEWVDSARGRDWRGGLTNIIQRRLDRFQSPSCNAYEPMREALAATTIEVERDLADFLSSVCVVRDEGPDRSTLDPEDAEEVARLECIIWRARAALSTFPVNDRHHSGSDSYQADASAPALSEKVTRPAVPQNFSTLLEICREASFLLDRLADLEFSDMDDLVRDYDGHVEPSISRLRKMLADDAPAKTFAAYTGKLYAAAVNDLEASDADGIAIDGTDIRSFRKGYEGFTCCECGGEGVSCEDIGDGAPSTNGAVK